MNLASSAFIVLIGFSVTTGTQGCYHRNGNEVADSAAMPDSVQGIVSVNGTSFEHNLVIRSGNKAIPLVVTSSDTAALTRLAGVETLVRGRLDNGKMHVRSFTAMRVDGAPVIDGVLIDKAGQIFLSTPTGMHRLGNPPAKLRTMISARVWVGGPIDTGPNSYGVIVPPRR